MTKSIGEKDWGGVQGQIQLAKPKIETYVRYGGNTRYVQRVAIESPQSQLTAWKFFENREEIAGYLNYYNQLIGSKTSITLDTGFTYTNCIVEDYSYSTKRNSRGTLLTINFTITTDNSTAVIAGV